MPLDFLKRKGNADGAAAAPAPAPDPSGLLPEEVVAQDHLLKLYYAGKSSEGVRLKAGPAAIAELPMMLVGLARAEIEVVEPLPIEFSQATPNDRQPVRGDAVAQRPSRPLADHPPRAGRPRVDRCGRSRLRHVRLLAARRRGRHVRLPRVQRDRRWRGGPLGRGDRRHDLPGRRRLGRQGRPRRHRPDRGQAARRHPQQHPGQPVRARPDRRSSGRCPAAGRGGLVCAHCGFASAHERAFYCPKCGMRLLRG